MGREFIMPGQIISGEHALETGKAVFMECGKKALLVTDEMMVQLGNVKPVTDILDSLSLSYIIYDGINGEPTDIMIEKGLSMYTKNECDFLIGLGGGSPLDSMKAIGALATNGGSISDYMGKVIPKVTPKMIAIPTTAGTGSEATQFTIIADTKKNIKMLLKGPCLIPDVAIIDPVFTITAPKKITAATGLDALTHAIEAYTSKKAQDLSDVFAVSAVKRIFTYLPKAFLDGNDMEARNQMSLAALEAGIAFNNSSVTLVHGMSRPIGALFHVPHGISNAMLLHACFTFALDGAFDRFGSLAKELKFVSESESEEEASKALLKKVKEICTQLEVPTLLEYGIQKEEFFANIDKMAADAMDSGSPGNTRKSMTAEDIKEIYQKLW